MTSILGEVVMSFSIAAAFSEPEKFESSGTEPMNAVLPSLE
jgi:hypothetical protein